MEVEIYVKPECKNNKKQIAILEEKGHTVIVKNIFDEKWTKKKLHKFFENISFNKWYNPFAPNIKSGKIKIEDLSSDNLLCEMLKDNYLIRRPLLRVGDRYDCGFDSRLAKELTGNSDISETLVCHQVDNVCEEA